MEEIPSQHAEGNHEERRSENSHGPSRNLLQFEVVGRERCDERFGLPHHGAPAEEHERPRINERELERRLDAVIEPCAVIVPDDGLRSVDESQKREHDNRNNAVDDAECRNCEVSTRKFSGRLDTYVAVIREAPCQNRVHEAVANLHHGGRESQNVNLADVGGVQLHVAPANLDGRGLLHEKLRNQAACDQLRTNCCPGGPFDSPVEFLDENPVQNDIADRACDFAEHGGFGVAHGADKVVHAGRDCLENCTAQQNAHVAFRDGERLFASSEQLEERCHEHFAERKGENRHDYQ